MYTSNVMRCSAIRFSAPGGNIRNRGGKFVIYGYAPWPCELVIHNLRYAFVAISPAFRVNISICMLEIDDDDASVMVNNVVSYIPGSVEDVSSGSLVASDPVFTDSVPV